MAIVVSKSSSKKGREKSPQVALSEKPAERAVARKLVGCALERKAIKPRAQTDRRGDRW